MEISDRIWRYNPNLKCYCGRQYKRKGWLLRHKWHKHPRPNLAKDLTYDEFRKTNPMLLTMRRFSDGKDKHFNKWLENGST